MRRILTLGSGVAAAALTMVPFTSAAGAASTKRSADESFSVYAFPHTRFVPAAGTNPKKFKPGDELIINDQLAVTHAVHGHYRIIGHDTGMCVTTHVAPRTERLDCVVTMILPDGSITVQGQIRAGHDAGLPSPQAITGGTGEFAGAAGTMTLRYRKHYTVNTFNVT